MGAKDSFVGKLLGNAEKFTDKQVAETLALFIEHGVRRRASDIHIEPHERFVLVRYRIDGTLRGVHKVPRIALGALMAQLKTLAGLNPQDTHLPQEGEYTQDIDGKQVEIHLTTMPVYGGEKAVLHLVQGHEHPLELERLGFWGEGLHALKSILANPHGLVTVAGPRHSGVSATLFSMLREVNSPLLSIATVETSPKHRLPGVSQTYVAHGMSPADGLKATLKQDPNIIMVDNIADGATAGLAVHAATTGHLLLAGMHADGAIPAVLRLRHSGVEPFLVTTALRASVGQRLVRKLCPECRVRYVLDDAERAHLEANFGITTANARKRVNDLEQAAAPAIFGDVKQLSSTPAHITHLWRASETGCDACDHSGYDGQTAITEVLTSSAALQKLLLAKEPASAKELHDTALKDGFVPMGLDGLVKALRGQTTITEVLRAVSSQA